MTDLIEVGQSELKDFRQCPLKHRFRWTNGWYQPIASDSSATGTLWHTVQAAHYRDKMRIEGQGKPTDYTAEKARRAMSGAIDLLVESEQADEEQAELLRWMAGGYVERWGTDRDWEVVGVEERLRVPLVDPDRPRAKPRFVLRFTADLRVRIRSLNGALAIVDNKTVSGAQNAHTGIDVDLDDQLGLYTGAMARRDPKDPPLFAMLNQVRRDRLKRPMTMDERFFRPRSTRTRREVDEIIRDALADMERMHGAANQRRSTSAPNPRQCGWSCDFKEAHIALRRSGGDWSEAERIMVAANYSQDPDNDPALTHR